MPTSSLQRQGIKGNLVQVSGQDFYSRILAAKASLFVAILSCVIGLTYTPEAQATDQDETRAIAYLSKILEIGRSVLIQEDLDRAQKIELLRDAAAEYADFDNVKRIVLGPAFNSLTPEQLDIYSLSFREYLTTVLALRMVGFESPEFHIQNIRSVGRHYIIASIAEDLGKSVVVEWLMTNVDTTEPKVMDVVVGGASMLAAQRAEISQVFRNNGFEELIRALAEIAEQR